MIAGVTRGRPEYARHDLVSVDLPAALRPYDDLVPSYGEIESATRLHRAGALLRVFGAKKGSENQLTASWRSDPESASDGRNARRTTTCLKIIRRGSD